MKGNNCEIKTLICCNCKAVIERTGQGQKRCKPCAVKINIVKSKRHGVCVEPGCQEKTLGRRQRCLVHWSARRREQIREWNEKYGGPAANIRRTEHTQNELSKQKRAYVDIRKMAEATPRVYIAKNVQDANPEQLARLVRCGTYVPSYKKHYQNR